MFYDRKIKYLDYYENGGRVKGGGFVKLEAREGRLRVEISVAGLHATDSFVRDVVFCGKGRESAVGRITVKGGSGRFLQVFGRLEDIGGTGISYEELQGVRIPVGGGREVSCSWGRKGTGSGSVSVGNRGAGGEPGGEVSADRGTAGSRVSIGNAAVDRASAGDGAVDRKSIKGIAADRVSPEGRAVDKTSAGYMAVDKASPGGMVMEKVSTGGRAVDGGPAGGAYVDSTGAGSRSVDSGIPGGAASERNSAGNTAVDMASEAGGTAVGMGMLAVDSASAGRRTVDNFSTDTAAPSPGGSTALERTAAQRGGGNDVSMAEHAINGTGKEMRKRKAGDGTEKPEYPSKRPGAGVDAESGTVGSGVGGVAGNRSAEEAGGVAGNRNAEEAGGVAGSRIAEEAGSGAGSRKLESAGSRSAERDERKAQDREKKPVRLMEDKWQQLYAIYPHVTPFHDKREYLSISPADFVIFPSASYRMINNSFLLHGYYNYRHLILAKMEKRGETCYFVGVPGTFFEKEKQVAVMFGFESFECAQEPAQTGDFGYYMMRTQL